MFGGRFLRRVALACAATALAARADPRKLRREILVGFCNVTAPYFDVSAGERCGDFTIVIKDQAKKMPTQRKRASLSLDSDSVQIHGLSRQTSPLLGDDSQQQTAILKYPIEVLMAKESHRAWQPVNSNQELFRKAHRGLRRGTAEQTISIFQEQFSIVVTILLSKTVANSFHLIHTSR